MNPLPKNFDSFQEKKKNNFLNAKKFKDNGEKIVGIFCTYTPKEIIYASGANAFSLCGSSQEGVEEAEKYLPKNLCPLIKASYGLAKADKCPFIYYADMIIGETTCDGKKKMYELLDEIRPTHVMQLPQKNDKQSLELWKRECEELIKILEKKFNAKITEEKLIEAIKFYNEEREIALKLHSFLKLTPPPISGSEIHEIFQGMDFSFDKNQYLNTMKEKIKVLEEKVKKESFEISPKSKRILITGCPSGGVYDKIIKEIEKNDAIIVAFENCSGLKNFTNLIDENGDLIENIAKRYLKIPCSVMTPNNDRLDVIKNLISEYKVDGVVDIVLQACHTYSIETNKIRTLCQSLNTPYISIETDFSTTDTGQINTRLEALVEML